MQAALGLKQGVVSSGNSLDYTDKCMDIMSQHSVAIKEMEAAAIAWACGLYQVMLLAGCGAAGAASLPRIHAQLWSMGGVLAVWKLSHADCATPRARQAVPHGQAACPRTVTFPGALCSQQVPLVCIKAVTDIVDGGRATQEEFLENLHAAAAALQSTMPKVLEFVAGKTAEQL
jgi:hypothetical protein